MSHSPTLVFIPGSWHKPSCYDKVVEILQGEHNIRCACVKLPSTNDNPAAIFKDDVDAARDIIRTETSQSRDVIVIAHSYGGMVGNSAIQGFTRPKDITTTGTEPQSASSGYVKGLVLIASGFTITGLAFMDPLFGTPPPSWRVDKETGYAVLVADPRELFYHDLSDDEAAYWVKQLTTQSLKALFEGGEHAYAGWQDVPTWYVGTLEDRGLPVVLQRVFVGMARGQSSQIHHVELKSSHSPFLSLPDEVAGVILDAVSAVSATPEPNVEPETKVRKTTIDYESSRFRVTKPMSWLRFGIPFAIGRVLGWGLIAFMRIRRLWRKS